MADTYVTMQDVADDALIDFQNALEITKTANTDYQDDITDGHWDKGGTIKVREPNNYIVGDGEVITGTSDQTERSVNLTITYRKHIEADFTTRDLTLSAKTKFRERFITPAMSDLANIVDQEVGIQLGQNINYWSGAAGATVNSFAALALTNALYNKLGIPRNMIYTGLGEDDYANLISTGTLQNSNDVPTTRKINKDAFVARLVGSNIYHSLYMHKQTAGVGDGASTPANGVVLAGLVDGAVASGSVIHIDGLTDSTTPFKKGDKIYIDGVNSVNPKIFQNTGKLMQFTVTADVTLSGSTEADVPVSPTIISDVTSPYRNVTNVIPNNSQVYLATANTGAGSTTLVPFTVNAMYHPSAILFAAPPLMIPQSVVKKAAGQQKDPDTGISIRLVEGYDITHDKVITRFDIIFAIKINPSRAVGLLGA